MSNEFWINVSSGVVSFIVISLITFLWKKYHGNRSKYLLFKTKLYPLPEMNGGKGNYSHYGLVAIWNPTAMTIKNEDITEPIKVFARGASFKILTVTDGRMSKSVSENDGYILFNPDEIPPKSGVVIALNPCNAFYNVDGQINNKPLYKYSDCYLPDNLSFYVMLDGAALGLAYLLTLFSVVIAPESFGVIRYFLPIILFSLLLYRPFNGFSRYMLDKINMPKALRKSFEGSE